MRSLPARPGHSRDTPVTETTWTYSRQTAEVPPSDRDWEVGVPSLWPRPEEFFNSTGWAFYAQVGQNKDRRMLADLSFLIREHFLEARPWSAREG